VTPCFAATIRICFDFFFPLGTESASWTMFASRRTRGSRSVRSDNVVSVSQDAGAGRLRLTSNPVNFDEAASAASGASVGIRSFMVFVSNFSITAVCISAGSAEMI